MKTVPDLRPGDIIELRMVKTSTVLHMFLGLFLIGWMIISGKLICSNGPTRGDYHSLRA